MNNDVLSDTCYLVDRQQADLVRHILTTWPLRETMQVRLRVSPQAVVDNDVAVDYERAARRRLDDALDGRLVVERSITWWSASVGPESPWMLPIRNNLVSQARYMAGACPLGMLTVQAQAVVLPPLEAAVPSNDATSWAPGGYAGPSPDMSASYWLDQGPDASSPDTSKTYPLDGLLERIDGLTR